MKIKYIAKKRTFTLDFSGQNHVASSACRGVKYAEALFCVSPGESENVDRCLLLRVAGDVLRCVEADLDRLQYSYAIRCELTGVGGAGGMGALVNGKSYAIRAGAGECYMQELVRGKEGKWYRPGPEIDLRSEKVIQTEDIGKITITRKKKPMTIQNQLKEFISFLNEIDDESLVRALDEGEPTPLGLVRELEEDEGLGEEMITEKMRNMGEKAAADLLKYYANPKYLKHRETIHYMLTTYYKPAEIDELVERVTAKETSRKKKVLYETLLEALRKK